MATIKLYKCEKVKNCGDCVHAKPHEKNKFCAPELCIYKNRVCKAGCKPVKGKRK